VETPATSVGVPSILQMIAVHFYNHGSRSSLAQPSGCEAQYAIPRWYGREWNN